MEDAVEGSHSGFDSTGHFNITGHGLRHRRKICAVYDDFNFNFALGFRLVLVFGGLVFGYEQQYGSKQFSTWLNLDYATFFEDGGPVQLRRPIGKGQTNRARSNSRERASYV